MSALAPLARTQLRACTRRCQTLRTFATSSSRKQKTSEGRTSGQTHEQANDPTPAKVSPNVFKTNEVAIDAMGVGDAPLQEYTSDAERRRTMQAPNRAKVWSISQMPRELAMSGPRFEQTIMEMQPRPYAAIELIHKQPVRWVDSKSVPCDGGGGPLGHPKIFINTDKPQICMCTYCGLPYANKHHRKYLESQPPESLPYPLYSSGDPAEVQMPQTITQHGEIQGRLPQLKGELRAESVDGQPFTQR
ncbi:hypothetical protein BT93_L5781 [Corymbia citriodora subsp. variegata]|uniref:Zinc finger CHCC-type domain-containing protein n=1 Tax=Corymbia citriodora subsp. variegata TaxID=360336 RepID=A0A8T0CF12_CORYI|nr:hypothetical protein BT93_L5781 [Corymbia citriodora subsp. variegata]